MAKSMSKPKGKLAPSLPGGKYPIQLAAKSASFKPKPKVKKAK